MMAAHTTHSIEQDSRRAPSLCVKLSAISAAAVVVIFSLVAIFTREWAWLTIPAAVLLMAGVQGLLLLIFPGLRGKSVCRMEGCNDAR